jgi:hypothetical protein
VIGLQVFALALVLLTAVCALFRYTAMAKTRTSESPEVVNIPPVATETTLSSLSPSTSSHKSEQASKNDKPQELLKST